MRRGRQLAGSDLFSRSLAPLLVVALLLSLAGSAAPRVARGQALSSGGVTSAAAPRTGPSPTALTAHAPIDVGADADFTAANGVVRGRGTAADPYVIAGWNITATDVDGIYIYGTTAHFVIRDLAITVTGFACSVSLETVQFGTLANATLMSETANVCVFDSSDVVIQGNALAGGGLLVDTCLRVTVTGNVLVDGDGVEVADSDTVTVAANRILGSGTFGVEATYSGNVTISGNVVEGRDFDGIAVDSVSNAAVSGNDVRGSGGAGIYVSGTDRSVVADNNVSGSWSGGIDLEYVTNATVRNNRLTDDGLSVYGGVIEEYDTHAVTGNSPTGK